VVALAAFWLGMVVAISFMEAPLKFRAPGVTIQLGLAIGRLVFRALNTVECLLAAVLIALLVIGRPSIVSEAAVATACVCLAVQLLVVRPVIVKRSDAVPAGDDYQGRTRGHLWYVGLECLKVLALICVVTTMLTVV
jgi:hypothetical protein